MPSVTANEGRNTRPKCVALNSWDPASLQQSTSLMRAFLPSIKTAVSLPQAGESRLGLSQRPSARKNKLRSSRSEQWTQAPRALWLRRKYGQSTGMSGASSASASPLSGSPWVTPPRGHSPLGSRPDASRDLGEDLHERLRLQAERPARGTAAGELSVPISFNAASVLEGSLQAFITLQPRCWKGEMTETAHLSLTVRGTRRYVATMHRSPVFASNFLGQTSK